MLVLLRIWTSVCVINALAALWLVFSVLVLTEKDTKRWSIEWQFKWFDMWVGAYWDVPNQTLYIVLFPTVVLRLKHEQVYSHDDYRQEVLADLEHDQ